MDVLGLFRLEIDGTNTPELPVVILTVVSYAISILLFSTHLIVFSFTQKMWTTIGKILASFCMSMILGFCAYISSIVVKNEYNKLYIVGVLFTYYCSLTHSSWLLSISFECWRTSKKTKCQRAYEDEHTSRFIWYSLFSWIEPAIFLGLALYGEFFDVPVAIPSYLKPTFITNEKGYKFQPTLAFLLFFVGPLCFNLFLNAIFLMRTHCLMKRLVRSDYSSENIELAREFKLYSRFNIFIILMWLVNVLDAFLIRFVICNLFLISLNAVQALYVLFVFTFNNKIWTLVNDENEELDLETFEKKSDLGNTWRRSDLV